MSVLFNFSKDHLSRPSNEDEEVTCIPCLQYGTIQRSKLIIPCVDCAKKKDFNWMGKRCYGAFYSGELTDEKFASMMFNIWYLQRHDKWMERAKKNNRKCIQEMIQDIPYEVFDKFMEKINNHPCLICPNCK